MMTNLSVINNEIFQGGNGAIVSQTDLKTTPQVAEITARKEQESKECRSLWIYSGDKDK